MTQTEKITGAQVLTPVLPNERIETIDILRGFALLGILLVNIEIFNHPIQRMIYPIDPATGAVDRVTDWLVRFFAEGKFYSLFSTLFGLGFGIQLARAESRGRAIAKTYSRRLLLLLVIGILHALLLWVGDILMAYALLGFVLLLFRDAKPRTLLIWAGVGIALPILLNTLSTVAISLAQLAGPQVTAEIDRTFAVQDSTFQANLAEGYAVYGNGTYPEIFVKRLSDLGFAAYGYLVMGPSIFAMFLIGFFFARKRVFSDIENNAALFRKILLWSLPIGIVCNAVYATLIQTHSRMMPTPSLLLAMVAFSIGAPALSLTYLSGITIICRRPAMRKLLRPLAAAGRFPLTNYLLQTIICTTIFYAYGFGLFGQLGKLSATLLAVAVYVALILLSRWWGKRFQFGPAEWVWRALTYGVGPPMKRAQQAA